MQFSKDEIQRNVTELIRLIEAEQNPEAKVALKLRMVEWNMKLQGISA